MRNTQDPLAYRLLGKNFIQQQGCRLGHTTGATAWAKASTFAAKGNQVLRVTTLALHAQKSVLKATALEIILELLLNIPRQIGILRFEVLFEGWVVFINDLIEKRSCGAVTHVDSRANPQSGFLASGQHGRILAMFLCDSAYQPMEATAELPSVVI